MSATTQELIAHISVEGAESFREGITAAEEVLIHLAEAAIHAGGELLHMMEHLGTEAFHGFVEYTREAVEEATRIQTLRAALGALSGSMSVAGEEIDYLRAFARTAFLQFDDLTEAMRNLAAVGLEPRHWLTFINDVAGAAGGGRGQVLMLVRALDMLAEGRNPMRLLNHFGITKQDLQAQGMEFSKGNHITTGIETNLQALEAAAKVKFGDISKYMETTMGVAFSRLKDSWLYMLDQFGQGWFPLIQKVLDSISPLFEFLASSGKMKEIATDFANTIDKTLGIGSGEGLQRIVAYIVTAIGKIPEIFRMAWEYGRGLLEGIGKWFGAFLRVGVEAFGQMMEAVKSLEPVLNRLGDQLDKFTQSAAVLKFAFNSTKDFITEAPWNADKMKKQRAQELLEDLAGNSMTPSSKSRPLSFQGLEGFLTTLPRVGDFFSKISRDTDDLMAAFKKDPGLHKPPAADTFPMFTDKHTSDEGEEANRHLKQIVHNTASMADFKKYALGGGERGAIGITPSEFFGQHSGSGPIQVSLAAGASKIEQALAESFMEFQAQFHRGGFR